MVAVLFRWCFLGHMKVLVSLLCILLLWPQMSIYLSHKNVYPIVLAFEVYVVPCMSGACSAQRGQKRALYPPPGLDFRQMLPAIWVLGAEPKSPGRAASVLDC